MRDHPFHQQPIMGGLCGYRLDLDRMKFEDLFSKMLQDSEHSLAPRTERNHDQILLEKHLW